MGVLNSFLPGGGEFVHQKIARGFLPGGWSGLELTDTLILYTLGLGKGLESSGVCCTFIHILYVYIYIYIILNKV